MSNHNVTAVDIKDLITQIQITSNALYEFSSFYPEDLEPYNLIYLIAEKLKLQIDDLYVGFVCLHGDRLVQC